MHLPTMYCNTNETWPKTIQIIIMLYITSWGHYKLNFMLSYIHLRALVNSLALSYIFINIPMPLFFTLL